MTAAPATIDIHGPPLLRRGKVRDVYDLHDKLLIVASDRLSAFDVVLPTPIPGKGKILPSRPFCSHHPGPVENHLAPSS